MADIILIGLLALAIGGIVFHSYKKRGQGGCSGCSGCSLSDQCPDNTEQL